MTDPVIKTYSDKNIKFKYNAVNNSTIASANAVGASTSATLRTLDFIPTDLNTIYVSKTGNDGTGTGATAAPVLTIAHALTICTATKTHIVIKDSGTYAETGINFTGDCVGIYAAIGQTPTIDLDYVYDGSAFTTAIAETAFIGTDAGNKIVEVNNPFQTQIIALKEGGYAVMCCQAGSTVLSMHVIDENYTQITEHDFIPENSCFDVQSVELDNGYIFSTYMLGPFESYVYKYWYLYSTSSETPIDSNITDSSFLVATLNSPKRIGLCKYEGSNDNYIFLVYTDAASQNIIKGCIYDVMNKTVIQSDIAIYTSGTSITNCTVSYISKGTYAGKYIVSFVNGSLGSYKANYTIINDTTFDEVVTQTDLFTVATSRIYSLITPGNNIVFYYSGSASPYNIYYRVLNLSDASVLVAETDIMVIGGTVHCGATLFHNGDILFAMCKLTDKIYYYATITPNEQYFLKLSDNAIINGIKLTSSLTQFPKPLIQTGAYSLTAKYCDLYDIQDDYTPSILISGTGAIDIQNCKIYNCEKILTVTNNSVTFKYNAVYFNTNGIQLQITGAGAGIIIDHCTFFGNYQPIKLINNNGLEIIKNCIFRLNTNGAIQATTTFTITYCDITDTYQTVTLGIGCITYNPMIINDGMIDPDDIDLNLRSIVLGYSSESPAIGTAETGDMGAYDVTYTYLPASYTIITVPKPKDFDVDLESFNQIINEMQDGSISKVKDGNQIILKIKWNGLKNEYANSIIDMFDAEGDIYVYLEPITRPNEYLVMKIKSDKLSVSPKYYKHSEIGVNDIQIELVGKYN